ncbi:MAG: metal-sensing transcriptional repressor [Patescibacteria group bacterium]
MKSKNKRDTALIALKKAQSHLANIIKMTEDGKYCINIMQQNLAVMGLLKSAHQALMENHLNSCFLNAMASGSQKQKNKMIEEILTVAKLHNK